MDEKPLHSPPLKTKLLFWFILGSFSVFFAEVVSGSYIFPYFTPWGMLVVMPLYTLHILVLSYVAFSHGKPVFYSLFIAGALFGMYEAYITKVLWSPTWGEPIISVGGIALIESVVLVLFWHPFMSFIIPLFAAEKLLTISSDVSVLPDKFMKLANFKNLLPFFALLTGLNQSANSPSPVHSLLSGLSTTGFLFILVYIWKARTQDEGYTLHQLLPSQKEFSVLFTLLISFYIVMGVVLRPEALPGFFPQLLIWLIYGGLFVVLYRNLKESGELHSSGTLDPYSPLSLKNALVLSLIFTLSSALSSAAHTGLFIMAAMWIAGILIGIMFLFQSIKSSFIRHR